jgi:hypothetical protein
MMSREKIALAATSSAAGCYVAPIALELLDRFAGQPLAGGYYFERRDCGASGS